MVDVVVICKRCGVGVPLEPEEKELLRAGGRIMVRRRSCDAEEIFQAHDRRFFGSADEIKTALDKEAAKK